MSKPTRRFAYITLAIVMLLSIGFAKLTQVEAGPSGPQYQLRALDQDGTVRQLVYVSQGVKTMAGANTPVSSTAACGLGSFEMFSAQVVLTGTMAGTAPTLALKWQNSKDGGVTWADVGTWTTINATVTPATQNQTVSDVWNNTTAVAYGDCWRVQYTFGGSGTVTANFGITGEVQDAP